MACARIQVHVSKAQKKELCDAFAFALEDRGKLLIYNRYILSGTSEGAWQ
jgi:hypothetical protein